MENFIKSAHDQGVYRALVDAGLVKEANVFLQSMQKANRAASTTGQQALQMGVGAGMGAMAAGEGNRGMGALLGGAAGFGAGRLNHLRSASRMANPQGKLKAMADSYANMGKVAPNVQRAADATFRVSRGVMAGGAGLGAGIGLNMMT